MFELERWGYAHVASTANCGPPAEQYEVALIDWRRRTFRSLETTVDWLVDFLRPDGVLVVWTDRQKVQTRESVNAALERRGFIIEVDDRACGWLARFGAATRGEADPKSRVTRRIARTSLMDVCL